MLSRSLWPVFIAVLILVSCQENPQAPQEEVKFNFPNSVGSQWKYVRYDSLQSRMDTLEVDVTREFKLPDSTVLRVWRFTASGHIDSSYVVQIADTVLFIETFQSSFKGFKLVFPLTVGNSWVGKQCASFRVGGQQDITVPAGSFTMVGYVDGSPFCPNDLSRSQFWLESGIGIVKLSLFEFMTLNLVPEKNETWELLSYNIPK